MASYEEDPGYKCIINPYWQVKAPPPTDGRRTIRSPAFPRGREPPLFRIARSCDRAVADGSGGADSGSSATWSGSGRRASAVGSISRGAELEFPGRPGEAYRLFRRGEVHSVGR